MLSVLLDATAGQQQSSMSFWIMMILIIVVFYVFMILPQRKKQKELDKQREAMKAGDKVVTASGVHGKIAKVKETTLLIEIANDVVVEIDKSSVYAIAEQPKKEEKKEETLQKEEK